MDRVALVVAAGLMLAWKYRLTGRLGWSDLWLPLAALAMRQYETILVVNNASHSVFPLVLMMVAAWLLTRPLTVARWGALGVVGWLALFTGFGIFVWGGLGWLVVLTVGRLARGRRWRELAAPLAGGAVLVVALGWFAVGYRFNPASPGAEFPHWPLADYPKFVVLMLASRMDLIGATPLAYAAGSVGLVLGIAALGQASWRVWRDEEPAVGWVTAAVLLATGLGFAFFTASGRVHLGVAAGEAPRYTSLMVSFWLGFVAWASASGRRGGRVAAAVLGWLMVVAPWADLRLRTWADWPGTMGMSEGTRISIGFPNNKKIEWLNAWEETGDWREAERRVPEGVHPEAEKVHLGEKVAYLVEHHLSFAAHLETPRAWMPWWNPLGVTWVKALGGVHQQWMAEDGVLWIEGRPTGFLNMKLAWKAPALPEDAAVEIRMGDRVAVVPYGEMLQGISVAAPTEAVILRFRSVGGTVPLYPPQDRREGSFLVVEPTLTDEAAHPVRWWTADEVGLWPEQVIDLWEGFHGWEDGGAFGWSSERVKVSVRSRKARYLNVEIESRYGAVNRGPVEVVVDGQMMTLPWLDGGLRFAVELAGGRGHAIELANPAGARSPLEVGESGDGRKLALRISRLTVDDEAAFPALAP